jgi:tetratricopeptide (TPR) repeat protein
MRAYFLSLASLAIIAFALSTSLETWFQSWAGSRTKSDNVLQVALGDGRKLFAQHFFAKADSYFHNGYYPSIYDDNNGFEKAHIVEDMHKEGEEEEPNFLGKPKDWIDRFSRHFYPARHTHLGNASPGNNDSGAGGSEREILPWLKLSAELDSERPETYVVGAYWLRTALKKVDEAEQFLREGLQNNPGDYEILFELGCIYNESRNDHARARNVWELALKNWLAREADKEAPSVFIYARILGQLAALEDKQKNYPKVIEYLTALKPVSPNQQSIQKWIDDATAKQTR